MNHIEVPRKFKVWRICTSFIILRHITRDSKLKLTILKNKNKRKVEEGRYSQKKKKKKKVEDFCWPRTTPSSWLYGYQDHVAAFF